MRRLLRSPRKKERKDWIGQGSLLLYSLRVWDDAQSGPPSSAGHPIVEEC